MLFETSLTSASSLDVVAICDCLSITCTSLPGWNRDNELVEINLPGVESLTEDQRNSLSVFAEYHYQHREPWPGCVADMLEYGGLRAAKRERMKAMLTENPPDDPLAGVVLVVAKLTNGALNQLRIADVPFETLIATAATIIDQGAGD